MMRRLSQSVFCSAFGIAACVVLADEAQVVSLQGKGEYRAPKVAGWAPAQVKQKLQDGGDARTLALSKMALLLPDQTQVTLQENTLMRLASLGNASVLRVERGSVASDAKRSAANIQMQSPHGTMSIRGTNWLLTVTAQSSEITVLNGTVDAANELGTVQIGPGEVAILMPGVVPSKRIIVNPAQRVQWVSHFRVSADAYPELVDAAPGSRLGLIQRAIASQDLPAAYMAISHWQREATHPAVIALLAADFALYRGEYQMAWEMLADARQSSPFDARITARWAEVALLNEQITTAQPALAAALLQHPQAAPLWLAMGRLAEFTGKAQVAEQAYRQASQLDPSLAAAWRGLGAIAAATEHYVAGRAHLQRALTTTPAPETLAELGVLETYANQPTAARAAIAAALTLDPSDFQALNALGMLELKLGHLAAARDALLKSSLIEPRHARTQLYLAAVYFLDGREPRAAEALRQAIALDANDPLPHFLLSMVGATRLDLGMTLDEARRAQEKIPLLKSLSPIAVDQQGRANLGYAFALAGMDDWAEKIARDSDEPTWAGSHFFHARQLAPGYRKQSELLQGYLSDPLSFGVSARPLLTAMAGDHISAGLNSDYHKQQQLRGASATARGLHFDMLPWAYFAEHATTRLPHSGDAITGQFTVNSLALGSKLTETLNVFAYANRFTADVNLPANPFPDVANRTDQVLLGGQLRLENDAHLWLALGDNRSRNASLFSSRFNILDVQTDQKQHAVLRYLAPRAGMASWSAYVDWNRYTRDFQETARFGNPRYALAARQLRGELAFDTQRGAVELNAGLGMAHDDFNCRQQGFTRCLTQQTTGGEQETALHPRAGIAFVAESGSVRLAYISQRRPWQDTDASLTRTVGIAASDLFVLRGGKQQQWQLEADTYSGKDTYLSLFVQNLKINNRVGSTPDVIFGGDTAELADLNRLVGRDFQNLEQRDSLEGAPFVSAARITLGGAAINQRISGNATWYARYRHADSQQTDAARNCYHEPVALLPRHQFNSGTTWAFWASWRMQAGVTYRSKRYESGVEQCGAERAESWAASLSAEWTSTDRRLKLNAHLLEWQKDVAPTLGLAGTYTW